MPLQLLRKIDPAMFGRRAKELRIKNNLTQEQVAEKLGLKRRQTIAEMEAGKALPEHRHLRALAYLYETSVSYLIGINDRPEPPVWPNDVQRAILAILDKRPLQGQRDVLEMLQEMDDLDARQRGVSSKS